MPSRLAGLLPRLREPLLWLGLAAIAAGLLLQLRFPTFPDPDGFYHFVHAARYASNGPFSTGFPWAVFSALSRYDGDMWYGFHLLLVPFTLTPDRVAGLKLAGAALVAGFLWLTALALRRLRFELIWVWPFLLLFAAPTQLWRWLAVRPYMLTMPLALLLLSLLSRGKRWQVGLCAMALAWLHQSFSWMVPLVVLAAAAAGWRIERRGRLAAAAFAFGGVAAAWLLRPDPIGAARLVWVQLVDLGLAVQRHTPLAFGSEVYPLGVGVLLSSYLPFLALWLAAVALTIRGAVNGRLDGTFDNRVFLWSTLGLSELFFLMTLLSSTRALEPWVTFAVAFMAAAWSSRARGPSDRSTAEVRVARAAPFAAAALIAALGAFSLNGVTPWMEGKAIDARRMQPAMEWLRRNSRPGEIVFCANWPRFSEMVFWNQDNRYVSGLDPIFLYAYDPGLYWKVHHLDMGDGVATTGAAPPGVPVRPEDTHDVLNRDFHAAYLLVVKTTNPDLYEYAERNPGFRLELDSDALAIFRVLPSAGAAGTPSGTPGAR